MNDQKTDTSPEEMEQLVEAGFQPYIVSWSRQLFRHSRWPHRSFYKSEAFAQLEADKAEQGSDG
jgi:hypothetical protein